MAPKNSSAELSILMEVLGPYHASEPRSQMRRDIVDAAVDRLNHINPNQWDKKRARQWLSNNKASAARTKSLSMSFEGGIKRPARSPKERMLAKRSNSFSQFGAGQTPPPSSNKETRKLETFFTLEHTRKPSNPAAIFEVTSGDELAQQLSFNWLLEERIKNTCDVVRKLEDRPAANNTDGAPVVFSAINPFVGRQDDAVSVQEDTPETQPTTPMDIPEPMQEDNTFNLLFPDEEEFGVGLGDFVEDPSVLLFGMQPAAPPQQTAPSSTTLQGVVRFEAAGGNGSAVDDGCLEPMNVSADWGPASSIRDGNVAATYARVPFSPMSSLLTHDGRLLVQTAGEQGTGGLGVCTVERDHVYLRELPLTDLDDGPIRAVAVDEERATLLVGAGKYVCGYNLSDMSRGPSFRLAADRPSGSGPVPLVMHGNMLYSAVDHTLNCWDMDEVDALSSSDMSSQMEFESVSSISEGESSPPMMNVDQDCFSPDSFTANLHSALGSHFCKVCGTSVKNSTTSRRCSECYVDVCAACAHVYKLTSLGEADTRIICNGCIPSIRKRILAKQHAARMPQLQERPGHSRHNSIYSQRARSILPHARQEVGPKGGSSEPRSIRIMRPDYGSLDSLVMSFEDRPTGLTWNVEHSRATRWFVGHTAGITAISTTEALINTVATGSSDCSAKIWDCRVRQAGMTLRGHYNSVSALSLLHFSSATYCITGGLDECIKVWDLRKQLPLYELATGNNAVLDLHWNHHTNSLLCTTVCPSSCLNFAAWPESAVHGSKHFPRAWHAGEHQVLQYDFTTFL